MVKPAYCIYPDVKSCKTCALVNYGMDCQNNPTWGGSRPGAGRKSTGRKACQFYITDDERKLLKEYLDKLRKGAE